MQPAYRCWAEVDLRALRENLAWLRHRVGPAVRIMTVVKADAYGHGLKQIAALLMQGGADFFGVANLTEAAAIREVGPGWPVLMLGACLPEEIPLAVRDDVRPTVSTLAEAQAFAAAARRQRKMARIHVKVDTGMGRLGVAAEAAGELLAQVRRLPGLELEGVFTHYAAAEEDAAFSRRQSAQFRRLAAQLQAAGVQAPLWHANNSAALLHQPDTTFNLVRPGLVVYGVIPPGRRPETSLLSRSVRPALSWKARVSLVKSVPAGTPLSYGGAFVTPRALRVGTVTVGYGDGYLRAGSNRACVLVGGVRRRVLGRVTMDQTLVDLTRAPAANIGDEVVLLGHQGSAEITAGQLAAWWDTIPWEVLTAITYRVPRIYRGGTAA